MRSCGRVRGRCSRRLCAPRSPPMSRPMLASSGAVGVVAPRVDDKGVDEVTGERRRFSSAILPPWCRKSPKIDEVLPLLYLHGLSSGDFGPALAQFLGTSAGLSASVITRLTAQWQDEAKAFAARDLSGVDYVYVWTDGLHAGVRLEQERLWLLVPQDRQRPCGTAEVGAPGGEEGPGRDLGRRGQGPRPGRGQCLRHALRG